jgi:hypothetical protein
MKKQICGRGRRSLRCGLFDCTAHFPNSLRPRFLENNSRGVALRLERNREAVRARSRAEFVSKIETALQELEETVYWIELVADGGMSKR